MTKSLLPVMILLNVVLAGLIATMPAVSEPDPPTITDAAAPIQGSEASMATTPIAGPPSTAETTMFGMGGAIEKKSAGAPMPPSQPRAEDMSLLGVLMARQDGDQQSVVSLVRHGAPPVVSRLRLGGTLDGWKLVSATRTTITLSGGEGRTRVLQIGTGSKGSAPP